TQKPDRGNDHVTIALSVYLLDRVINVGLQPGRRCARSLTLVRQAVVLAYQKLGRSDSSGGKLLRIGRRGCHGRRDGVRRIDEGSRGRPRRAERRACLAYSISNRLDKAWMSMPGGQVGDLWCLIP